MQKKKTESNSKPTWAPTHLHESRNQQPGVPRRVCRLVGTILYPVAGRRTRCYRARATHHSLLTQHQYREESGGGEEEEKEKQTFLCDKVAKVVSPMQESHHLAQMSWINLMPMLGPSSYTDTEIVRHPLMVLESPPGNPDTHTHNEETRQRMKTSRDVWLDDGWNVLKTQFM